MAITVFIADDHVVLRDALSMLLESQGGLSVIGGTGDGGEAVSLVQRLGPDVVIMDIVIPGVNGIEATRQIRQSCRKTQVVILSMCSTIEHLYRALRAGARAYVLKESVGKEVVAAIRAVHAGGEYLSEKLSPSILDAVRRQVQFSPLERLSGRERQVLELVVGGKSSAEIAARLSLSVKTVETYRHRLMAKLGLDDLPGLVKFAIQHGITHP